MSCDLPYMFVHAPGMWIATEKLSKMNLIHGAKRKHRHLKV